MGWQHDRKVAWFLATCERLGELTPQSVALYQRYFR
jgi:hypothetical protein